MLNLIRLKLNKKIFDKIPTNTNFNKINNIKNFSPTTKDWNNSIYYFNKNSFNLLPVSNKLLIKLIKRFFNIYNRKLELKIKYDSLFLKRKMKINKSRISSNKIYVSNGEFKHTNDKINIDIFIYNRQKYNYYYKLRQMKSKLKINFLIKKLQIIKNKASIINKNIETKFNKFSSFLPINYKLTLYNNPINMLTEYNIYTNDKLLKFKKDMIKKYITKCFRKEILHLHYRKLLILNNFKLKYTFLTILTTILRKMYNKKIELNIINLKYFYLNSDIYTESIINKITNNRKKLKYFLNKSTSKVKIKKYFYKYSENNDKINKLSLYNTIKVNNNINLTNQKFFHISYEKLLDPINILLYKIYNRYIVIRNKNLLNKTILKITKNKSITGVKLEAAGRLSKRHTASRSMFKLKSRGNLKNMDSILPGSKSSTIRGINKSNIQYTKLNSVINIGAFGLKGWISNN
jgi:hypothetical protein